MIAPITARAHTPGCALIENGRAGVYAAPNKKRPAPKDRPRFTQGAINTLCAPHHTPCTRHGRMALEFYRRVKRAEMLLACPPHLTGAIAATGRSLSGVPP